MTHTRILLTDDHALVLTGMLHILREHFPEAEYYTARDGETAVRTVREWGSALSCTDIAILDLELPDISGFDLIDIIRGITPGIKIIVNTVHEEIWSLRRLQRCAVDAVVFKSADSADLIQAVGGIIGEKMTGSNIPETVSPLSPKETEVLTLIASGMGSHDIAVKLFISVNTVESHRRNIMYKLETRNAAETVMRAIALGLIPASGIE